MWEQPGFSFKISRHFMDRERGGHESGLVAGCLFRRLFFLLFFPSFVVFLPIIFRFRNPSSPMFCFWPLRRPVCCAAIAAARLLFSWLLHNNSVALDRDLQFERFR